MANAMLDMLKAALTEQTNAANALADSIAAATSDRSKAIADYLNDPETSDPKVKAFQEFLEKIEQTVAEQTKAAEEHAASQVPGANSDPEKIEADKVEYKGIVDQIKAARKLAATIPSITEEDLKDVPALKNLRGATAGQGGTGGKRPRLASVSFRESTKDEWTEAFINREAKDGSEVRVSNFTVLANALKAKYGVKVEVKDLQAAAFEAAGTDDLNTLDGKVFDFATSVGDKTVFVQVAPKHADAE